MPDFDVLGDETEVEEMDAVAEIRKVQTHVAAKLPEGEKRNQCLAFLEGAVYLLGKEEKVEYDIL